MTNQEAVEFIRRSRGRFVSVVFRKRSDGTRRKMLFRLGVTKGLKGIGPSYDAEAKNLLPVWEVRNGFRSIPIEGIESVMVQGEWQEVQP